MNESSNSTPYSFTQACSDPNTRQQLLMDYLYGEMLPAEAEHFKEWVKTQPEIRREIQALRVSKDHLTLDASEPVLPPQAFMPPTNKGRGSTYPLLYKGTKIALKWAAAVLILFMGAKLLNIQSEWNNGALTLYFGSKNTTEQQELLRQNIRNELNQSLPEITALLQATLSSELDKALINQQSQYAQLVGQAVNRQQMMYEELLLGALNELEKQRKEELFNLQEQLLTKQDQHVREISRNREALNSLIQLTASQQQQLTAE